MTVEVEDEGLIRRSESSDIEDFIIDTDHERPSTNMIGRAPERARLHQAFMNMANSIIGAGVIGQAYAMRQAGLAAGVVLLVCLTFAIDWTLRLMVTNAKLSGCRSYQATVQFCFGKPGLVAVSLAQGLFAMGGGIAYCVIIGDTVPHVLLALAPSLADMPVLWLLTRRAPIMIMMILLISYPLSLYRNMASLASFSALALLSMASILVAVLVRGPPSSPPDAYMTLPLWTLNSGFFQAVSVISFAFVCHHNSLYIYDSMHTPTMDRFALVTHWSTGVSMVACMILALGGLLSFKNETMGNVLNNFPADDTVANFARFCFGFNMISTLPLDVFACREVLEEYFWPNLEFSKFRHVAVTTAIVLLALGVALSTCSLGTILELVGSISACSIAYILPPMCYLKLTETDSWTKERVRSAACVSFGVLVLLVSTTQSLIQLAHGAEHVKCPA